VSWLSEDVPEMLEAIVHRATRKSPHARYRDMAEFKRALDRLTGLDEPPQSRRTREVGHPEEVDVYQPVSQRGRRVAEILAAEFGIYSRPHSFAPSHSTVPPHDVESLTPVARESSGSAD
jgi:hypothetical protein